MGRLGAFSGHLLRAEACLKFSLQATVFMAGIFAAVCLGVAVEGFWSLGEIADPARAADARGFAGFWLFLASIAIVLGFAAWRIARSHRNDADG